MGKMDEAIGKVVDEEIKEVLSQFRDEIEKEHAQTLQEKGWRAPPKIDEERLTALNARSDELRGMKKTAAVMKERVAVRKEISEIVDSSDLKYKVNRQ